MGSTQPALTLSLHVYNVGTVTLHEHRHTLVWHHLINKAAALSSWDVHRQSRTVVITPSKIHKCWLEGGKRLGGACTHTTALRPVLRLSRAEGLVPADHFSMAVTL